MEPADVFGISMITEIERLLRGCPVANMVDSMLVKLLKEGRSIITIVSAIDLDVVLPVENISSCAAGDLEVVEVAVEDGRSTQQTSQINVEKQFENVPVLLRNDSNSLSPSPSSNPHQSPKPSL